MMKPRDLQQRIWGCMSASLLLHSGVGIAVAMAGTGMISSAKEQPTAVYISAVDSKQPSKGEQEALPPAANAEEVKPAKVVEAKAELPVKQSKALAPAPKKTQAIKPAVVKTLPVKKGKPAEPDQKVNAALAASREDSPIETVKDSDVEAPAKEEIKPIEAVAAPSEDESEDASASAMTAPTAEEDAPAPEEKAEAAPAVEAPAPAPAPEKVEEKKAEPIAALAPAALAGQKKTEAAAAASSAAPAQAPAASSATSGTGRGAEAASSQPSGIRDASELRESSGNRKPEYPDNDRLSRNQGKVIFVARVRADGSVTDIRVEQQTNSGSLNQAAMKAMKDWKFMPGQEGWVRKSFVFNLGGNAQEMPARLRR